MLIFGFAAVYGFAQSGTCGPNLTWSLDRSTGTLTISGTGEMDDYDDYTNRSPWNNIIKEVKMKGGVTSIGDYAFISCNSLTSITFPNSVTYIGENIFFGCSELTDIYSHLADPPTA